MWIVVAGNLEQCYMERLSRQQDKTMIDSTSWSSIGRPTAYTPLADSTPWRANCIDIPRSFFVSILSMPPYCALRPARPLPALRGHRTQPLYGSGLPTPPGLSTMAISSGRAPSSRAPTLALRCGRSSASCASAYTRQARPSSSGPHICSRARLRRLRAGTHNRSGGYKLPSLSIRS